MILEGMSSLRLLCICLVFLTPSVLSESTNTTVSSPQTSAGARVILKSITIYVTKGWMFYPQIYFRCDDGNETELPFVRQPMHYYSVEGNETWQPLFYLEPHQCKECGVYDRVWIGNGRLGEWKFCTNNFSSLDSQEMLTATVEKGVTVNLACPNCPVEDEEVRNSTETSAVKASSSFQIFVGVFVLVGVLALTITGVTLTVLLRKDSSPVVFEEQSKMLEMGHPDSAQGGLEGQELGVVDSTRVWSQTPVDSESRPLQHVSSEKRHVSSILRDDSDEFV